MTLDDPLDDVADAILDGTAIDWDQVDARAGADRVLLEGLKELAALAKVHRDVPLPTRWGHLALIEPLGRGAFGRVLRAGGRDTLWRIPNLGGEPQPFPGVGDGAKSPSVGAAGRLV